MRALSLPVAGDAERAILGSMLLYGEEVQRSLCTLLTEQDFHRERHALLFGHMVSRRALGRPLTVHTYVDWLLDLDEVEVKRLGGHVYVGDVVEAGCDPYFIPQLAQEIRLAALRREVIALGAKLTERHDGELAAKLRTAQEALRDLQARLEAGDWRPAAAAASSVLREIELRVAGETVSGQRWGYRALDAVLNPRRPGELIIVAGRPAMGKSPLLKDLMIRALDAGETVALVTLEMPESDVVERIYVTRSRVNAARMKVGDLNGDELRRVADAAEWYSSQQIDILDVSRVTAEGLFGLVRRLKERTPALSLVGIDYLQLIEGGGRSNRQEDVSDISRTLKVLARELGVTVIALSQLNRGVESRVEKRPQMSDLRESGAIEQDADAILFVYRDEYYKEDSPDRGLAEVIVAKQRGGMAGAGTRVKLAWTADLVTFDDIERRYDGGNAWTD